MFKEKLCQIGFTEKEAMVYLELLTIGPQAASVISKRVGMNRSTTYSILKTLIKKGVLSTSEKSGMQLFIANDPNCLIGYIDRKCRTFDYYREDFVVMVPKFRNLGSEYSFRKPVVKFFEGVEGCRYVMNDALKAKGEICSFIPIHKYLLPSMKDFIIEKLKFRAIVPELPDVREFFEGVDSVRLLYVPPTQLENIFENQINIYDDKVTIMHWEKGEEYGVVINSKEVASLQRLIFEMAWKGFESCLLR
jgi:sugar-specific transcriptional regulator TrmB